MTETDFQKWPSIMRHDHAKQIRWWWEEFPGLGTDTFVVTEKIHGASVQIRMSPSGQIRYGTRNGYRDGDTMFGWPANAEDVIPDLDALLVAMKSRAGMIAADVILFGEIFGPGVQKNIDYGPEKRVFFFGGAWMPQANASQVLWRGLSGVLLDFPMAPRVPIVDTVSGLAKALEVDAHINSLVPGGEESLAEGVVITPLLPVWGDHGLFMVKKKNPEHEENAPRTVRAPSPNADVIEAIRDDLRRYLTAARMRSVFSKHGPISEPSQIGEYIKLIIEDAMVDFTEDGGADALEPLDEAERKRALNMGRHIAIMLKGEL